MASADHNIEGASKLSEKDGAGRIEISKANQTGAGASAMLAYASDFPEHFTFYATQGQKIRVVDLMGHMNTLDLRKHSFNPLIFLY